MMKELYPRVNMFMVYWIQILETKISPLHILTGPLNMARIKIHLA